MKQIAQSTTSAELEALQQASAKNFCWPIRKAKDLLNIHTRRKPSAYPRRVETLENIK